jgi:hypothetical protein
MDNAITVIYLYIWQAIKQQHCVPREISDHEETEAEIPVAVANAQ